MKEFVVYILWSATHQKIYIGFTSNLITRFYSHNQLASKGFTKKHRPWSVIWVEFKLYNPLVSCALVNPLK